MCIYIYRDLSISMDYPHSFLVIFWKHQPVFFFDKNTEAFCWFCSIFHFCGSGAGGPWGPWGRPATRASTPRTPRRRLTTVLRRERRCRGKRSLANRCLDEWSGLDEMGLEKYPVHDMLTISMMWLMILVWWMIWWMIWWMLVYWLLMRLLIMVDDATHSCTVGCFFWAGAKCCVPTCKRLTPLYEYVW